MLASALCLSLCSSSALSTAPPVVCEFAGAPGSTCDGSADDTKAVGAPSRPDRSYAAALASAAVGGGACAGLDVTVDNATQGLALGADESYTLSVRTGRSTLRAATAFGAMRGLETFSQLLLRDDGASGLFSADVTDVEDAPAFGYRALLVDTARHYLPVATLLAILDGLAFEKLNVMHWHAVDDESFPLEVLAKPTLAPRGAFGTIGHTYSRADVAKVVAYGRARGIRVILEIDTPGHSRILGEAFPALGLVAECPGVTPWPPLDISKASTLAFVADLVRLIRRPLLLVASRSCCHGSHQQMSHFFSAALVARPAAALP